MIYTAKHDDTVAADNTGKHILIHNKPVDTTSCAE